MDYEDEDLDPSILVDEELRTDNWSFLDQRTNVPDVHNRPGYQTDGRSVRDPLSFRGPVSKYPWDEWTDGKTHVIEQGEDFTVSYESMRTILYSKARRMDMKVWTNMSPDGGMFIRFYRPGVDERPVPRSAKLTDTVTFEE